LTRIAADAPLAVDRSVCCTRFLGGVSFSTLNRLIRNEGFPPPRLLAGPAGTRRFLVAEVMAWLESRPAAPGGAPGRLRKGSAR
jgi:predicted DNA-binding transcriptional regulator AlpA